MYFSGIFLKCIIFWIHFERIKPNTIENCTNISINAKGTKKYLDELFRKYGSKDDNFGSIKTSKFEKLLATISLGRIKVECEDGDAECLKSSHENEDSKPKRKRRDAEDDMYNQTNHISHWQSHMQTVSWLIVENVFKIFQGSNY